MLYAVLIPIASLDIIPSEITTDLIFDFSDDIDYNFNARMDELGYENHNTIENLGSMFYFILYSLILVILSLILKRCNCKNKMTKELKRRLKIFVIIQQLFIIFQEGFIEILVSCYINFNNRININWSDKVSSVFTIIYFVLALTAVPGLIIYVMTFSPEKLNKKST